MERLNKTVGAKLAEARTLVGIKKTGTNAFAKYSYYQIDEIYSEAKGVFKDLGIMTVERVEPMALEGKIYLKFFLDVINTDDMSDKITFETITEPNGMKGAQAAQEAGSTITYMSKYLYGLALMIDDGKSDPDATNTHKDSDVVKKSLTRQEIQAKIKELPQAKQETYMKELMEKDRRTTPLSITYWKQDFLNDVAKREGWLS
ncbi:MAG: ERF family protein [Cetobacterium sp.]|uniref:ERF family protein n=1 Tax=Cetobacterium sp. TaxID=2071632 RepID=UPI003F4122F5